MAAALGIAKRGEAKGRGRKRKGEEKGDERETLKNVGPWKSQQQQAAATLSIHKSFALTALHSSPSFRLLIHAVRTSQRSPTLDCFHRLHQSGAQQYAGNRSSHRVHCC